MNLGAVKDTSDALAKTIKTAFNRRMPMPSQAEL
jgi:hypothetical protein